MNLAKQLRHLAVIPDGNRRWGKQNNIGSEAELYKITADNAVQIATHVFELGIPYMTFWSSSVANIADRNRLETIAIENEIKRAFVRLTTDDFVHNNRIKIEAVGRWRELLRPTTVQAIEKSLLATNDYADSGKLMTILVGYDGNDERGAAVINLVTSGKQVDSDDILTAAESLRRHAWTGHLPDVDLIVRTGSANDPHNSAGFLSLITDNTQLAFLSEFWPDLTPDTLDKAIDDYLERERRLGK